MHPGALASAKSLSCSWLDDFFPDGGYHDFRDEYDRDFAEPILAV